MKFDVYYPFKNKEGKLCPGITPHLTEWSDIVNKISTKENISKKIDEIRAEADETKQGELKKELPAICYVGWCSKTRAASAMQPTSLVMVDIDHCEDAKSAYEVLKAEIAEGWWKQNVMIVHLTPRKGLRIIFVAQEGLKTLQENMDWFNNSFKLDRFGKYDAPCKDFSRISFIFKHDDLLFENTRLYTDSFEIPEENRLFNEYFEEGMTNKHVATSKSGIPVPNYTEEDRKELDAYEYRGTLMQSIIQKYVEVYGTPSRGEIHSYYNEMVKFFRNIMNNDKKVIFYFLPKFGHSDEECWSSIVSICRSNTTSELPKKFYFFLKDNGFYKAQATKSSLRDYMLSDDTQKQEVIPWMPPVFKELVGTVPKDFKVAAINALLPIIGTLTSYVKAKYYFDKRDHTTSFFSIIYAPAGTGKGFVEFFVDLLLEQLKIRDEIQSAREQVYLDILGKKGANDKSPDNPHTSRRLMPAKNSEAELLAKMQDNHGYHMFTFAAEMDSWAKGVRAAGGNKDDMMRIAWDNGSYGQAFKGTNTFKGDVRLYWNVLISGTLPQIEAYFRNVENGLVTRCSFTDIPNQEFANAPDFKDLSVKSLDLIRKFTARCDAATYEEPCTLLPEEVKIIKPEEFDNKVDWRFHFRERKEIDMSWLKPTIVEWLKKQQKKAAIDYDKARDVFRRRAAVRGFRLGLICTQLWAKPTTAQLNKCKPFIEWWMDKDLECSLELWGSKYNELTNDAPQVARASVFNSLPEQFSATDVYTICVRQNIKSPVRNIVYQWTKIGAVEKVSKNVWKKKFKNESRQKGMGGEDASNV